MSRAAVIVASMLVVAVAGALGWLWITPAGQVKGVTWTPPAPVRPALEAPAPLPETGVEATRFVATLERPLFVATRRPPPPPAPLAAAQPAVDLPPDMRVLGIYGATGGGVGNGGIIARIEGQVKRVKTGDSVGRWTVKELRPGEVVLAAGDSIQTYALRRASADEPPVPLSADNANPSGGTRPPSAQAMLQKEIEQARQNVRRINALRARSGMPPVPEP